VERWSRACSTDSFRGRLWRGPGANSSSALVSVLMADFGSTIRQASLLTPRVVIGSRNSSSPRSTTLHAGRANVAVAALGVEFRPLETDVFAHDCSSGRKVAVLRTGWREGACRGGPFGCRPDHGLPLAVLLLCRGRPGHQSRRLEWERISEGLSVLLLFR